MAARSLSPRTGLAPQGLGSDSHSRARDVSSERRLVTGMSQPLAALDTMVNSTKATVPRETRASHSLLGFDVGFPIGVASSAAIRTPRHVEFFARRGFNVLTFKTVRSRAWPSHSEPNWVYLDDLSHPLELEDLKSQIVACGGPDTRLEDLGGFSTANSFGVPSPAPPEWQADFAEAKRRIDSDQLLIASVQGSPEVYRDYAQLVDDFVRVVLLAEEAGARVIELNFSCPNTFTHQRTGMSPPICETPSAVQAVVEAVRGRVGDSIRIIAKLSYLSSPALAEVVVPIVPLIDAISGINTLPVHVVDDFGHPTFKGRDGEELREVAGLSGVALRDVARRFVQDLVGIRDELGASFAIFAMGGVMNATDVRVLMDIGADAVQSVTAAVLNPELAAVVTRELDTRPPDLGSGRRVSGVVMERAGGRGSGAVGGCWG